MKQRPNLSCNYWWGVSEPGNQNYWLIVIIINIIIIIIIIIIINNNYSNKNDNFYL